MMGTTACDNIAQLIHEQFSTQPDKVVLTFECGDARPDIIRSYRDLWRNCQALARGLKQRGIGPGSVIALVMANHAEFVEVLLAGALLRAAVVPIDPRTRGEKLVFMMRNSKSTAIIAADYALPNIESVGRELLAVDWVCALATDEGPPGESWRSDVVELSTLFLHDGEDLPVPQGIGEEIMQIIHTSGTTGDPKGIVLTHQRFCDTSRRTLSAFGYQSDDRLYSGLSLTHANAMMVTMGPALTAGIPAVFSRRFTRSRLWAITRKYQCTTFTLLGGMTTSLYAKPSKPDDADNPVRFVVSAGMPAVLWQHFEHRFGVRVLEFYGSAEGGLAVNPIGVGPVGSFGKLAPGYIYRIVDDSGVDVPRGHPGELWVRAADMTPYKIEYFGNPQASALKGAGGWLHMGDVVHEDAEGWLYFDYRKGGGIRRNGDFISPSFVEKAIAESGMVQDVFVYGIPSSSGAPGEKDVVAAVVPWGDRSLDAQALYRWCRSRLESNFVPGYLQVVDQIPKTASEKPQEHELVKVFAPDAERVYRERRADEVAG